MSEILAQVTRGPMVESVHRGSLPTAPANYCTGPETPALSPICVPPPSLYRP